MENIEKMKLRENKDRKLSVCGMNQRNKQN